MRGRAMIGYQETVRVKVRTRMTKRKSYRRRKETEKSIMKRNNKGSREIVKFWIEIALKIGKFKNNNSILRKMMISWNKRKNNDILNNFFIPLFYHIIYKYR